MFRIGLTGSIGMGKSQTAALFEAEGIACYDSDAAVHRLYAKGGAAVAPIGAAFPHVIVDGAVDRARLSAVVLEDKTALMQIEAIVHPLVRRAQAAFEATAREAGAAMVVLDIPLLFEAGAAEMVDAVIVVSAPPDIQRARVLARPDMSAEKFAAILAKQLPDAEKRARADFVIDTSVSVADARRQLREILVTLRDLAAKKLASKPRSTKT